MAGNNLVLRSTVLSLIRVSSFISDRGLAKICEYISYATLVQVSVGWFRFNSYSQNIKSGFSRYVISHYSICVPLCKAIVNPMLVYDNDSVASLGGQPQVIA